MEENWDWKPCDIKLESEFIIDDDCNDNSLPGPCQEAISQVPDTVILKLDPVDDSKRFDLNSLNGPPPAIDSASMDGDVRGLMAQIKVENTEAEDPLVGSALSEEWIVPSETVSSSFIKEEPKVFVKYCKVTSKSDLSEGNIYSEEKSIPLASENGDEKGVESSLSQNCGTTSTDSRIRIKTPKIKDTASNVGSHSHDLVLPTVLNTRFQIDELSSTNSTRKKSLECFNNEGQLMVEPYSSKEPLSCEYCSRKFSQKGCLNRHLRINSGEKPFYCEYCPAGFTQKCSLITHLRIHSAKKSFSCKLCPAQFKWKSNLVFHLCTHSGEKPFSCEHCPARFIRKYNLTTHLRNHTGEKPFSCEQCPARFNLKGNLTTHLRSHSAEKNFSCNHCSAEFATKGNLTRHLRIHSSEKPFSCKQCLAQFNEKFALTRHLRIHSDEKPFYCVHCPAQFRWKSNFTKHLRIHSGEKQFSCKHCSAQFNQKSNLTHHLRIHSSKKQFSCEECSLKFERKKDLRVHILIHSDNRPICLSSLR